MFFLLLKNKQAFLEKSTRYLLLSRRSLCKIFTLLTFVCCFTVFVQEFGPRWESDRDGKPSQEKGDVHIYDTTDPSAQTFFFVLPAWPCSVGFTTTVIVETSTMLSLAHKPLPAFPVPAGTTVTPAYAPPDAK